MYIGALSRPEWSAYDPGAEPRMRAAGFDEVDPMVEWKDWPRTLANAYPEIGVAPLILNHQNSCKSELHWLHFAACGAPCIGERFPGAGPYDVIRDGVDGLLARGRREWSDSIGRLAKSPQLRADIGGAARERVIAEYNPRDRAAELADALRWAAEHAGSHGGPRRT
jgi:glycosyltransferase involved in cell wall biosynthesis